MTFDPRRAPFRRENVMQPFVALRDGEPVGRIVATIEAGASEEVRRRLRILRFHRRDRRSRGVRGAVLDRRGFPAGQGHAARARAVQPDDQPRIRAAGRRLRREARGADESFAAALRAPHRGARLSEGDGSGRLRLPRRGVRGSGAGRPARSAAAGDPAIEIPARCRSGPGGAISSGCSRSTTTPGRTTRGRLRSAPRRRSSSPISTLPACRPGWIQIATYRGEDVAVSVQIPDANEALRGAARRALPLRLGQVSLAHPRRGHEDDARADDRGRAEMAQTRGSARRRSARSSPRTIEDARAAGVEEIEYQLDAGNQRRGDQRRAQLARAADPHVPDLRAFARSLRPGAWRERRAGSADEQAPEAAAEIGRRSRAAGERRSPPAGARGRGEFVARPLPRP